MQPTFAGWRTASPGINTSTGAYTVISKSQKPLPLLYSKQPLPRALAPLTHALREHALLCHPINSSMWRLERIPNLLYFCISHILSKCWVIRCTERTLILVIWAVSSLVNYLIIRGLDFSQCPLVGWPANTHYEYIYVFNQSSRKKLWEI